MNLNIPNRVRLGHLPVNPKILEIPIWLLSEIAAYVAPLLENDEHLHTLLAEHVELLPIGVRWIVRVACRVMAKGIAHTARLI
ncbi:hypothetical protein DRQ00_05820, partial [candidate division KSB1 bacterium]